MLAESTLVFVPLAAIFAYSFYAVLVAGQLSLGQAGFAALAGFTAVTLAPDPDQVGDLGTLTVGIAIGMTVGAVAAAVLGLPTMRLRGVFLAIATLGFAEAVRVLLVNSEWTGGAGGLTVPKLVTPALAWVCLAAVAYWFWRQRPSRYGRALAAIREDELAARAMGIDVGQHRLAAFVNAGAIAGLYGVLWAFFVRLLAPEDFAFSTAIDGLVTTVVGGATSWLGPLLGGALLTVIPEVQRAIGVEAGWLRPFLAGLLLLVVILFLPGGLAGLFPRRKRSLPTGIVDPSDPSSPSDPSDPADSSSSSDPSHPADSSSSSDPSHPADSSSSSDPSDRADSSGTGQPARSSASAASDHTDRANTPDPANASDPAYASVTSDTSDASDSERTSEPGSSAPPRPAMPSRRASPTRGEPLVQLRGVGKDYGGVHALSDVDMVIHAGEVVGLIGPNGAGKTTLVNLISGLDRATSGTLEVLGTRPGRSPVHRVAAAGVSRTFQHSKLFPRLSALENVLAGAHLVTRPTFARRLLWLPSARRDEHRALQHAARCLQRVGLTERAADAAGTLSYGDQRRLEIARALASEPSLLILDEPAAGMNQAEANQLSDLIGLLAGDGLTVLLIEHNVAMVRRSSDRLVVLDFGRVLASGAPQRVLADPTVLRAYLGETHEEFERRATAGTDESAGEGTVDGACDNSVEETGGSS